MTRAKRYGDPARQDSAVFYFHGEQQRRSFLSATYKNRGLQCEIDVYGQNDHFDNSVRHLMDTGGRYIFRDSDRKLVYHVS